MFRQTSPDKNIPGFTSPVNESLNSLYSTKVLKTELELESNGDRTLIVHCLLHMAAFLHKMTTNSVVQPTFYRYSAIIGHK